MRLKTNNLVLHEKLHEKIIESTLSLKQVK